MAQGRWWMALIRVLMVWATGAAWVAAAPGLWRPRGRINATWSRAHIGSIH